MIGFVFYLLIRFPVRLLWFFIENPGNLSFEFAGCFRSFTMSVQHRLNTLDELHALSSTSECYAPIARCMFLPWPEAGSSSQFLLNWGEIHTFARITHPPCVRILYQHRTVLYGHCSDLLEYFRHKAGGHDPERQR